MIIILVHMPCSSNNDLKKENKQISSYYQPLVDTILHHSGTKFIQLKNSSIHFYYEPDNYLKKNINKLVTDATASLAHCKQLLSLNDSLPPLTIIYFNNREKLRPYVNMAPKGIALPDAYTLLIATNDTIRAYHTHEMMHILSWHQFGGYASAPADWIQEGFSVYADNPCMNYPIHQIAAYLYHAKKIVPLKTLIHQFRTLPDVAAYMQAGSVVQFFIEHYGYEKFQRLWKEGMGKFSAILGISLAEFEKHYQNYLLKTYPKQPDIDWKILDERGCG